MLGTGQPEDKFGHKKMHYGHQIQLGETSYSIVKNIAGIKGHARAVWEQPKVNCLEIPWGHQMACD